MSTTSKEWRIAPGQLSDKLYRVNSKKTNSGMLQVWLEVKHVPPQSEWVRFHGHEASVLIAHLRDIANYDRHDGSRYLWSYMGGRGGTTRTLARLNDDNAAYEISTDEGATWRETDHPYALALRVLELDPA